MRRAAPAYWTIHINVGRFIDVRQASALYRLLGDEARLRLLRVLDRERLNVDGADRHPRPGAVRRVAAPQVAEGRRLRQRGEGRRIHLLPPGAGARRERAAALWAALQDQFAAAAGDPAVQADEARLQEVLRLRKENFESHAADTRDGRQLVPGRSWAAWSRALGLLLPPLSVADLGCGEGYLTIEASRWARGVIGVDRSEVVLDRARALGPRRRVSNVVWQRGELEKLPIKDESVDVALLSQALHHAADPARAVAEAARITVPGGRVLVLDLREHREEWVRAKLGDRRLGFRDDELRRMLADAGTARRARRRRRPQSRRSVRRADRVGPEAAGPTRRRLSRRRNGVRLTTHRAVALAPAKA